MKKFRSSVPPVAVLLSVLHFAFSVPQDFDLKASIARGESIYAAQCASCHMTGGEGLEDIYPPLAKSDYLMADKTRSIREVIHGVSGEITVNGKVYNSFMSGLALTDEEVSDVLNYIRNSWGNTGEAVTPAEVADVRKQN